MAESVQGGGCWLCPVCKQAFDPDELRDGGSLRVFFAAGLCQTCQDRVYGEEGVPVSKVASSGKLTVLTKTLQ